jgi:tRNA-modifying protein YgfZ
MNGVALRPRAYVAVKGPDAEDFLQRMVSNDVTRDVCEALLLTAKARVIAPLVVWRRAADDYLLLTEPELGDAVLRHLTRMRLRADVDISGEHHTSHVVFGGEGGLPTDAYGTPAVELLDGDLEPTVDEEELERLRVLAGTPRWGREIDDRVLPAEAGLDETAISFSKGCYPGQEPIARQRHRGRVNRTLRVLEIDSGELPPYDAELSLEGKAVGRITSAVRDGDRIAALAFVRVEVPDDATLEVDGRVTTSMRPARVERATSASAGHASD